MRHAPRHLLKPHAGVQRHVDEDEEVDGTTGGAAQGWGEAAKEGMHGKRKGLSGD